MPGQLEVVPAPGDGVVDGGAGPEGGAVAVVGVGCLIRKAVVSSTTVKSKHGPEYEVTNVLENFVKSLKKDRTTYAPLPTDADITLDQDLMNNQDWSL